MTREQKIIEFADEILHRAEQIKKLEQDPMGRWRMNRVIEHAQEIAKHAGKPV